MRSAFAAALLATLLLGWATAIPCCFDLPRLIPSGSSAVSQGTAGPWAALGWQLDASVNPVTGQPYVLAVVYVQSNATAPTGLAQLRDGTSSTTETLPLVVGQASSHALLSAGYTLRFSFDANWPLELRSLRLRRSIVSPYRTSITVNVYNQFGVQIAQQSFTGGSPTRTLQHVSISPPATNVSFVDVRFSGGYGGFHSLRVCTKQLSACPYCEQPLADQCVTATPSVSESSSMSPSTPPTVSNSPSPTASPSWSSTPSQTPSTSSSPTASTTASVTPSPSEGSSPSSTPSNSPSISQTSSPSESPSSSASQSPSVSASQSASNSASPSVSQSPSASASPSVSQSATPSISVSSSSSPSASPSASETPSMTPAPLSRTCDTGLLGRCSMGAWIQGGDGKWTCTQTYFPRAELCNGLDDNCNGLVDEGLPSVSCGVGQCSRTVYSCAAGHAAPCIAGQPQPEICNSLDDDCNGRVDDQDVCNYQVFVVLNVAVAPLPYCRQETADGMCIASWSLLTLDRLPGTNESAQTVQLQAGYVATREDEQRWIYDAQIKLDVSLFNAVRISYNCSRPVFLQARVPPELLRPTSSRTLPQLQRWQLAGEPSVPCSVASASLSLRIVSSTNALVDSDGQPLLPMQPMRESCVYRQDELCSVMLGYYNPNEEIISAVSFNDMLSNRPNSSLSALLSSGQYQTNLFLPGRVYAAMTIQWQCAADAAGWQFGWQLMDDSWTAWGAPDLCG
jgi:hypothetical protein